MLKENMGNTEQKELLEICGGKKYSVIYADPAWSYDFKDPTASKGGAKGSGYSAGVNYYYGTMTIEEILRLPVKDICEKNAVCFLWATNPLLPEALATMKAWGFKYKTCITWHKERCKGMGYWFRGHTEHLLLGTKGTVKAFRSLEHNIKKLPVEKHSKKPNEFRKMIEVVTEGMTRIELFARQRCDGWDAWGNETDKFEDNKTKTFNNSFPKESLFGNLK